MDYFKPAGAQARWRYLYDLLRLTDDNEILTYRHMAEVLGLHWEQDRGAIRVALCRAAEEHEKVDKRAIAVVPNRGYRIVAAKEHLDLAKRHQTRSTKALQRGQSKIVNVDMSKVQDPEVRKGFEVMAQIFAYQMDFSRRADEKLKKHGELIDSLVETTNRSEAERSQIAERVARLEKQLGLGSAGKV